MSWQGAWQVGRAGSQPQGGYILADAQLGDALAKEGLPCGAFRLWSVNVVCRKNGLMWSGLRGTSSDYVPGIDVVGRARTEQKYIECLIMMGDHWLRQEDGTRTS